MKVSLRVILGVCFLIGALLFFCRGENHYALIFLLVGALYLYKGLSWGLNLVINFCISRIEWISLFSDIYVTIFFFSKAIDWFYSLFRAKEKGREGISEHDWSYFVILCITQESSGNTLYDSLFGCYLPWHVYIFVYRRQRFWT